jgi:hypothetical protein
MAGTVTPFLTIYTPTYERPSLLAKNIASVDEQTLANRIQHLIIRDEIGIGVAGMFAAIPDHASEIKGEYVYILQDDDKLASKNAVERLRLHTVLEENPPVVICRNRKRGNIYPTFWGRRPKHDHIDLGSFVIRRDIFLLYADKFPAVYDADFFFIDSLWSAGLKFAWADFLLSDEQIVGPGLGRPERELITRQS